MKKLHEDRNGKYGPMRTDSRSKQFTTNRLNITLKNNSIYTGVKKRNYLGITLTKVQKNYKNLYSENYKIFLKEGKKFLNKWKDNPCSWA